MVLRVCVGGWQVPQIGKMQSRGSQTDGFTRQRAFLR